MLCYKDLCTKNVVLFSKTIHTQTKDMKKPTELTVNQVQWVVSAETRVLKLFEMQKAWEGTWSLFLVCISDKS